LPTALITGIAGQDGALLASLLRDDGYVVVGLVRPGSSPPPEAAPYLRGVSLLTGDLLDPGSLRSALAKSQPDEVYNLAGVSSVAESWKDPELTAQVNGNGVLNLVRAVLDHRNKSGRAPRLLQASSAEMFGSPQQIPQDEETPLRPRNPYAAAKAFAHEIVASYREGEDLFASTVILYNHESTLRPASFVTRKITRTVAAIALGRADQLVLGNLESQRDWGYAGDYVKAMSLALRHDVSSDFVVATGVSHSVRDFVSRAFSAAGISDWSNYVRSDRQHLRPTDARVLVGDASRARSVLGWEPTIDFDGVIELMVRHDLELMSAE
jgi:GDPmannose 4,6-dehydratase